MRSNDNASAEQKCRMPDAECCTASKSTITTNPEHFSKFLCHVVHLRFQFCDLVVLSAYYQVINTIRGRDFKMTDYRCFDMSIRWDNDGETESSRSNHESSICRRGKECTQ